MAGGFADLLDFYEQTIAIAIVEQRLDFLNIAGLFPLDPILLARTAPESGFFCFQCSFYGFLVHVGNHEDDAVFPVLNNRANKSVVVEFKIVNEFHDTLLAGMLFLLR